VYRPCAENGDGVCPNYCGFNDRCKLEQSREARQRPREMTAADLGLRCSCDRTDCAQCSETFRKSFVGPYAFWLGAEG
jgi:hypothetical protein